MDQVKVYLGVAKKHHFWILVAIVVITAIIVWLKASSTLATKYEADKRTITGAQDSVQKASSDAQVNNSFTNKVEKLHEGLKDQVFDAWKKLYDRQVVLFRWPDLSDFDNNIDLNKLRPDEDIPIYICNYLNEKVVRQQWEELLERVELRRPKVRPVVADADDGADSDSAEDEEEKRGVEYEGLVVWKPALREAIISRYYTRNATPSTKRLRLAQEDVWLFESLVDVVNKVNEGAKDSLKAPIKEILTLDVAQWAVAASLESGSALYDPKSAKSGSSTSAGAMPMGGGAAMPAGAPAGGAAAGPAGAAGAAPNMAGPAASGGNTADDNEWLDGRYLDEKGQPLKAGGKQPFAEFDQVFVYMKFIMDQRRIPELVAACANAPLPIETRQVRVQMLKSDGGAGGGLFPGGGGGGMPGGMGGGMPGGMGGGMPGGMGGGMPGGMGGGMPGGMGGGMPGGMGGGMPGGMGGGMPGGMGGGMPGGMGGGMPGGMGGGMPGGMGPDMGGGGLGAAGFFGGMLDGGVETTVFDALVELSGVIYLYKPPDIAKLGTGEAGSPEKRSFGVPTTAVHVPGSSGGAANMMMGPTMAPMP